MLSIVVIFGFFSWSFQYFKFFFRIPHILSVLGRLSLFETVDRAKCLFSWVVFFCCILGTWRCVCFFVIKNRNVCFNFLPEPPNSFFSVCFKCTERFSLSDGWVSVFFRPPSTPLRKFDKLNGSCGTQFIFLFRFCLHSRQRRVPDSVAFVGDTRGLRPLAVRPRLWYAYEHAVTHSLSCGRCKYLRCCMHLRLVCRWVLCPLHNVWWSGNV